MLEFVAFGKLPIQILKDQYLSVFGGWSEELGKDEVGLNKSSLSSTDIHPYITRVLLRKFDARGRLPLFFKKWFEVIPLSRDTPDAYSKSPKGEVVLPESEFDSKEYADLKRGDVIVINDVLSKRIESPQCWHSKIF